MEISESSTSGCETWAERFIQSLGVQREHIGELLAARGQRLEQAGAFVQQQFQRLEEEIERLRADRDALSERLSEMESRPTESSGGEDCRAADEDLQRRYEMAMEDIREANDKNAELQQQLTKARSSAAKLAQQSRKPGWLDWETEKQRILDALETDTDQDDQTSKSERMGMDEVLRITDEVIAVKNREIQELKQRLEEGGLDNKDGAAEETAIKQAINTDAAIGEERNRLQELQKQWRDKLRQAEVELSLERARIARERAILDEQLCAANDSSSKANSASNKEELADRSTKGRWLSQLGLTAADREPSRR